MIIREQELIQAMLMFSILYEEPLKILYEKDNGETTLRIIQPLGFTDNDTNVLAICELRDDYRKFKLERIVAVQH